MLVKHPFSISHFCQSDALKALLDKECEFHLFPKLPVDASHLTHLCYPSRSYQQMTLSGNSGEMARYRIKVEKYLGKLGSKLDKRFKGGRCFLSAKKYLSDITPILLIKNAAFGRR